MNDRNELVVAARVERVGDGVAMRMEAPAPGSFWTARRDISAKWTKRRRCRAIATGTVLMIESIETADGAAHVYRFAAHPAWGEDDQADFHADDFYELFEPCADGAAHREQELSKLLSDMGDTQAKMLATPPKATPAGLLTHAPSMGSDEPGTALATASDVQNIEAYAANLQQDAEARSKWIQKHSTTLASQGATLARFHAERAMAALAHTQSQLESVKGLLRTVENLGLYTGRGVEVVQLREGVAAPAELKLTAYQELLAFDEETGALLDAGGIDHTHVDVLADAVQDMALVERMIPSERGMVLCQFRATDKRFFTGDDMGSALANARMNQEAQRHVLLVRDGGNLWLVYIEDVLQGIRQLLPSEKEQTAYFTGTRNERITTADLEYARAQRRQMGALDAYGKVLIVLWGLRDRDQVLADSAIPHFENWLDPAFQTRHLALVSHDNLIGEERPAFGAWAGAHNKYLAPGAWVAIDLRRAMDEVTASGAYGKPYYDNYARREVRSQIYCYKRTGFGEHGEMMFARLRSDARGLWVAVPCNYEGYRDGSDKVIKLYVSRRSAGRADEEADGVLALDRVVASDLDYYLTSRKERRSYAQYLSLFRIARTWVRERDDREARLRAALRQAVVDGRIAFDADRLEAEIVESLAIARTSRRGDEIPADDTPAFRVFWRGALATLHGRLTGHGERVRAVEAWADAHGRAPIRLVLTGSGDFKLYVEPIEDAREKELLGQTCFAERAAVQFQPEGVVVSSEARVLLRPERGHHVIHDWEAVAGEPGSRASDWLRRMPSYTIDHAKVLELFAAPSLATLPRDVSDPSVQGVEALCRWIRRNSKKSVVRRLTAVPIGLGRGRLGLQVIVARVEVLHAQYAAGDEAVKAAVRQGIEAIYATPEHALERVEKGLTWVLGTATLDDAWRHRDDLSECELEGLSEERCRARKDDRWAGPFDVKEVSAIGVQLFPWLAEVTKAPSPVMEREGANP